MASFNLFYGAMRVLPRNVVSYTTGALARLQMPSPIQTLANSIFIKSFGLKMAEAERPATEYRSIEDVFTRRLKPGLREIASDLVSPADGYLARSAAIENGDLVQAKGIKYSVQELVFGGFAANYPQQDAFSWFTTVYLAPHNYHRVHSPVGGKLLRIRHLPADLWPVNVPFVNGFPRLFSSNERLVFDISVTGDKPEDMVHVVMVGAFNVGRMETPFLRDFATNSRERLRKPQSREYSPTVNDSPGNPMVKAGEELGTFMLGSTVVIIFGRNAAAALRPVQAEGNQPILMGNALNR